MRVSRKGAVTIPREIVDERRRRRRVRWKRVDGGSLADLIDDLGGGGGCGCGGGGGGNDI